MFLRPVEAAELVGVSTRAIYRAIARGDLPAARLCSRLRIAREDFEGAVSDLNLSAKPKRKRILRAAAPTYYRC